MELICFTKSARAWSFRLSRFLFNLFCGKNVLRSEAFEFFCLPPPTTALNFCGTIRDSLLGADRSLRLLALVKYPVPNPVNDGVRY